MKLHYSNILLFFFPLNILLTSYHVNTHKKPFITPHHTQTNRSLCECDIQSTNCDKGADMKSAKEQFDYRTSQRFEEYDERLQEKRQKRKEQRDKNIHEIIEKDKMDKSLTEKIEKGCLRCGCGLGGVAASVGIFGAVAVSELTKAAKVAAIQFATEEGIKAGIQAVIGKIKVSSIFSMLPDVQWPKYITELNYKSIDGLAAAAKTAIDACKNAGTSDSVTIELALKALPNGKETFGPAVKAGQEAAAAKTTNIQTAKLGEIAVECSHLYSAIGYSVLAILIIVLIMIIIYLVLRYRRKKKMKKKAQYTKLLNE
ncbi:PIR protein [Plasmodium reichenowi]|uniref:PIR protein n=1 Tax=Plasmodium reichenowi TaxID=5854 RepID=A0A2P9DSR9_PLARE|nr:PIR protein [Plasmodium reichenowi]